MILANPFAIMLAVTLFWGFASGDIRAALPRYWENKDRKRAAIGLGLIGFSLLASLPSGNMFTDFVFHNLFALWGIGWVTAAFYRVAVRARFFMLNVPSHDLEGMDEGEVVKKHLRLRGCKDNLDYKRTESVERIGENTYVKYVVQR